MNEFQASLIAIGGAVIVGVLFYDKWREWRAKKSVDNAFSSPHEDVLMGDLAQAASQREQVESAAVTESESGSNADVSAPEPEVGDEEPVYSPPPSAARHEPVIKPLPLDEFVDCIIPMPLLGPVRGEKVVAAFQPLHLIGNKPVHVIGQNESGDWEPVSVGGVYSSLKAGMQMATRRSHMTELEFSELVAGINQLSEDLGAEPELPDMPDVMAKARKVHQFITEFDAKLSINVEARGPTWMTSNLRPALQRMGMDQRPDGILVMPDGEGGMLFSLSTNPSASGEISKLLTLLLPVSLVAPDRDAFTAMSAFAKSLAQRLTGGIVDDEGQPLSDDALAAIGNEVRSFYAAMEEAGVTAGSHLAHRLFA
ncbi:ZipA, C-terminal FtsZ-binding domain containing protein [Oxalobacteraceae bacterium]